MLYVHTALQELHAVVLSLCRMVFHLSGKVVDLHRDKSATAVI